MQERQHSRQYPLLPVIVFPYSVCFRKLSNILQQSFQIISAAPRMAEVFPKPQSAAFKSCIKLGRLLCRPLRPQSFSKRGCTPCGIPGCGIDPYLQACDMIQSYESGRGYDIRRALNCCSRNTVYVVGCKKCRVQGVGECFSAASRLPHYIRRVKDGSLSESQMAARVEAAHDCEDNPEDRPRSDCAIYRHFAESPHTLEDLSFVLVDQIPEHRAPKALWSTLRRRLEGLWMNRFKSHLNIRRN